MLLKKAMEDFANYETRVQQLSSGRQKKKRRSERIRYKSFYKRWPDCMATPPLKNNRHDARRGRETRSRCHKQTFTVAKLRYV